MKALIQFYIKTKKMAKKSILFFLIAMFTISCNTEKVNLSPLTDSDDNQYNKYNYTERVDQVNYSSEITNLLSTFPKFRNDAINAEITNMKTFLTDYIDYLNKNNFKNRSKSLADYQKSYKKLQMLKYYLNSDEADVLNRYLVRIKSNMNSLENQQNKNAISNND